MPGNGNGDPKSNYLHENIQVLTPELDYLHDNINLKKSYNLTLEQLNKINKLLSKHGINHDVVSLLNFSAAFLCFRDL